MAKSPKKSSAYASASLTLPSLLSLPTTPSQPSNIINPLDDPVIVNQLHHGRYAPTLLRHHPQADRRLFHPSDLLRPADSIKRAATRLIIGPAPRQVSFSHPDFVAICLRRTIRREVIHALGLTHKRGKGSGGRRRNRFSGIHCK